MDKIFSAGKDFLESQMQNQGQGQHNQQQQQQNLPPGDKSHGGNYPAGGGFAHDDDELKTAQHEAANRAGSSGSSELFSSVLSAIGQRKGQIANEDIDEEDAVRKHKEQYQNDSRGDENSVGIAAAMQALKMFNQNQDTGKQSQGAFLGLAMSEASKLFDQKASSGQLADGASKESTIQKAGEMAMKMYFKSQGQQQGGLMAMASKFIK
ncbi:beta-flanking protein [Purpureocillium lilacinum]|uniref:Beta-flanking protein n=1 Tax=Purpureocillium lilacinum TaxID=33203 RepID=A0A179GN57_PURLI|nr:beta-flanking protein [Purpureocillium lilacinum]OAQ79335.1 beta-flanking protein [Purpureocillium lilacinum]